MVKIFYDVETTGTNYKVNSVHKLAMLVEVDGVIVDELNLKIRPHPKAKIEKEALAVGKVTEAEIMQYMPIDKAVRMLIARLGNHIKQYDKTNKAHLIGFNNRGFDDNFLRMLFTLADNPYFGSWFWSDTIDTLSLASEYLIERRKDMPSFKLKQVAMELGLEVDKESLHDALFDTRITRDVYRIVTGIEFEL